MNWVAFWGIAALTLAAYVWIASWIVKVIWRYFERTDN